MNGVPACANHDLLTRTLRTQWGFHGYVVSDEGALANIVTWHAYTNTTVEAAAVSVKAGCNLELGGPAVYGHIGM